MATPFASSSKLMLQRIPTRVPSKLCNYVRSQIGVSRSLHVSSSSKALFPQAPRTVAVRREGPRYEELEPGFKEGKKDTLWQSWLNLAPTTRMIYGISVAGEKWSTHSKRPLEYPHFVGVRS